ncbi:hypothetical protein MBLNU459_g0950t1 [Dothideomycetes sp. NU459]
MSENMPEKIVDCTSGQIKPMSTKRGIHATPGPEEDHVDAASDDEPNDLDLLIRELQTEDGAIDDDCKNDDISGVARNIPGDSTCFDTDPSKGLNDSQVECRRRKWGLNQMTEEKASLAWKFFGFFVGPTPFVMEAAAILAAGLQHWIDLGIIGGLLLLNACVGFYQEFHAGNVVAEMKKKLALRAAVIRNGATMEIDALEVVPGDVLRLEEGDILPADGQLISIFDQGASLQIDQSAITGESLAVNKHSGDTCYASSAIKRGESLLIVTSTGDNTFVGRAAALASQAGGEAGHFTQVLNKIGGVLMAFVISTLLVVWISGFYRNTGVKQLLEYTLAVTIVGVPVGLPAVVTTTMAVGASFLARKQAIVQKLAAIESLAGVEILCSDKTGTLTKNKLSLDTPWTLPNVDVNKLMLTACVAASRKSKGMEAIDKVIWKSLCKFPMVKKEVLAWEVIEFQSFDPVSKKVTAHAQGPAGEHSVCVKGAPLTVLDTVKRDQDVAKDIEELYTAKVEELASRGFRSVGVARKLSGDGVWQIMGILPLFDPPRHDTAATVHEARDLGLSIKMLTGDAVGIAKETSRQLGLGTNIYGADRLGPDGYAGDMRNSDMYHHFVETADGFAGVLPQHKYNVVAILQSCGYLVAMTGDGVNDAPSLKRADTGIAVEGASDAARSAADIVFLAPGLSAIIDAIKVSRQIFHRMYSYVVYRIALSLHLLVFLGIWIAVLDQSLKIELVAFIAIFADIATLMIAYDNAPYSPSPIKWNLPRLWGLAILQGIVLAAGTWIAFTSMLPNAATGGGVSQGLVHDHGHVHGILFLQIALTQNWLIFITRADGTFWSSRPSWQLFVAVMLVDVIASLFCGFGLFIGGDGSGTDVVTIVKVWIWSFGVFCVMAGVHYSLSKSEWFDNLVHGRSLSGKKKKMDAEDFIVALQRVSVSHAAHAEREEDQHLLGRA